MTAGNTPTYSIKNLTKVYTHGNYTIPANQNISLNIHSGEIFGIFGPNGAGKTTLVRQMAGLIKPTSGSIHLNDIDVVKNPKIIPHHMAYFAQAPWILWSLKVWETIYFTGIFRGMSKKSARQETEHLMSELGILDIRDRLMEKISGGQSKLLGIAAALIGLRPVLIMDEPTNELDPMNRIKVWNLLAKLRRQHHITIILVTHNVLEAEQVVDRVMIVDQGKIIALGTPGELKAKVDDRVRIQVKFKPNTPNEQIDLIRNFDHSQELSNGNWQVFIPKPYVASVYNRLINRININNLDDFRMMTTTLEDVYIQMGGSNINEFQNAG